MSITAKELAKLLGLSPSAVSLALNDKPGVSEATRRIVLDAAKAHGFGKVRPGTRNRGKIAFLRCVRCGAVVSEVPFFRDMEDMVARECRANGFSAEISQLSLPDDIPKRIEALRRNGVDGIILLGTELRPEEFALFRETDLPVVVLDAYYERIGMDCVIINNAQGAYTAAMALLDAHRGQPGYLHSSYPISNFDQRSQGFYMAIQERGLSPARSIVHRLTPSLDGAYADMKAVLAAGDELASCYFADNDVIALGAARALREAGLRIPEDIALIGFDNMELAEQADPPLTTISYPQLTAGRLAAQRLLSRIPADTEERVKIEIQTKLVQRKSV